MFLNDNEASEPLPLYEVRELSMEEALLVLTTEKESLARWIVQKRQQHTSRSGARKKAGIPKVA